MKRFLFAAFAFAAVGSMSICCSQNDVPPTPVTPEPEKPLTVEVSILYPSDKESVIAAGRHIKVGGTLEWSEVQDDATVRVSLLHNGEEVRYAQASEIGVDNVSKNWYKGEWGQASPQVKFDDVAYSAPEFVTIDGDNLNSTLKCVYTEDTFYALLVSGTDAAHGNAMDDSFSFKDEDGKAYNALAPGKYSIKVTVTAADGKELAKAVKPIVIGDNGLDGAIVPESQNSDALKVITANASDCRVLNDPLPGEYGKKAEMFNISLAWATAYADYVSASTIRLYNYDIEDGTMTWNCVVASVLQKGGKLSGTDSYVFNTGEPSVAGKTGYLVKMSSLLRLCRVDNTKGASKDGMFVTSGSDISSTSTDFTSTIGVAKNSTFAVMGVTSPYLLASSEVVPDTKACYYKYTNGVSYLMYTFSLSGSKVSQVKKECGLKRSFDNGATYGDVAPLEFYHTFDSSSLTPDKTYDVDVQAYDKNDKAIDGMNFSFKLVAGNAPEPTGGNGTETMSGHPGADWDK